MYNCTAALALATSARKSSTTSCKSGGCDRGDCDGCSALELPGLASCLGTVSAWSICALALATTSSSKSLQDSPVSVSGTRKYSCGGCLWTCQMTVIATYFSVRLNSASLMLYSLSKSATAVPSFSFATSAAALPRKNASKMPLLVSVAHNKLSSCWRKCHPLRCIRKGPSLLRLSSTTNHCVSDHTLARGPLTKHSCLYSQAPEHVSRADL